MSPCEENNISRRASLAVTFTGSRESNMMMRLPYPSLSGIVVADLTCGVPPDQEPTISIPSIVRSFALSKP